jgi:hypothetical protein
VFLLLFAFVGADTSGSVVVTNTLSSSFQISLGNFSVELTCLSEDGIIDWTNGQQYTMELQVSGSQACATLNDSFADGTFTNFERLQITLKYGDGYVDADLAKDRYYSSRTLCFDSQLQILNDTLVEPQRIALWNDWDFVMFPLISVVIIVLSTSYLLFYRRKLLKKLKGIAQKTIAMKARKTNWLIDTLDSFGSKPFYKFVRFFINCFDVGTDYYLALSVLFTIIEAFEVILKNNGNSSATVWIRKNEEANPLMFSGNSQNTTIDLVNCTMGASSLFFYQGDWDPLYKDTFRYSTNPNVEISGLCMREGQPIFRKLLSASIHVLCHQAKDLNPFSVYFCSTSSSMALNWLTTTLLTSLIVKEMLFYVVSEFLYYNVDEKDMTYFSSFCFVGLINTSLHFMKASFKKRLAVGTDDEVLDLKDSSFGPRLDKSNPIGNFPWFAFAWYITEYCSKMFSAAVALLVLKSSPKNGLAWFSIVTTFFSFMRFSTTWLRRFRQAILKESLEANEMIVITSSGEAPLPAGLVSPPASSVQTSVVPANSDSVTVNSAETLVNSSDTKADTFPSDSANDLFQIYENYAPKSSQEGISLWFRRIRDSALLLFSLTIALVCIVIDIRKPGVPYTSRHLAVKSGIIYFSALPLAVQLVWDVLLRKKLYTKMLKHNFIQAIANSEARLVLADASPKYSHFMKKVLLRVRAEEGQKWKPKVYNPIVWAMYGTFSYVLRAIGAVFLLLNIHFIYDNGKPQLAETFRYFWAHLLPTFLLFMTFHLMFGFEANFRLSRTKVMLL